MREYIDVIYYTEPQDPNVPRKKSERTKNKNIRIINNIDDYLKIGLTPVHYSEKASYIYMIFNIGNSDELYTSNENENVKIEIVDNNHSLIGDREINIIDLIENANSEQKIDIKIELDGKITDIKNIELSENL